MFKKIFVFGLLLGCLTFSTSGCLVQDLEHDAAGLGHDIANEACDVVNSTPEAVKNCHDRANTAN